ncbi:hypothetical protein B566_EDAN004957 [Ephemera danica]|nr:hypothetical protein B566_EDAN004957 [Ephemera danica]
MQGYQPQQQQKNKRTWLNRVSNPLSSPRQNLHPAAMIHRDYLQLLVDPWHTPIAHHIHPAVVAAASTSPQNPSPHGICACPGTKKLGKPCKKCGLRVAAVNKGGTVRPSLDMNQNAPTISPMRLRPTPTSPQDEDRKIMQADPYDIMRRSRLSLQDKQGSVRTRSKSVSPSRARLSFPPSVPARTTSDTHRSRLDEWVACNDTPPLSSRSNSSDSDTSTRNKSILECDVSAYELISKYLDPDPYESDNLSDNAILDDDSKWKTPTTIPRIATKKAIIVEPILTVDDRTISMPEIPKPPPRLRRRVKKSTIKSILKKTSMDESPPVIEEQQQQQRFPTYQEFKQRKKQVQFTEMSGRKCAPEERAVESSEREATTTPAVSATSDVPANTCVEEESVQEQTQDKQQIHGTPSTGQSHPLCFI